MNVSATYTCCLYHLITSCFVLCITQYCFLYQTSVPDVSRKASVLTNAHGNPRSRCSWRKNSMHTHVTQNMYNNPAASQAECNTQHTPNQQHCQRPITYLDAQAGAPDAREHSSTEAQHFTRYLIRTDRNTDLNASCQKLEDSERHL